jgi:hypothetical protein
MAGATTVQAFPYPFINEAATPVSVQNLANAVDAKLATLDASRALALRRDTAQAARISGSQSITINTATVLTFNSEMWDTNGLYAPGTPDRLTIVRTGLYTLWGSYILDSVTDGPIVVEAGIRVSGTAVILQKEPQSTGFGAGFYPRAVSVIGMYRVVAAQTVQLHAYWSAPGGGPFTASQATLGARLVAI